MPPLNTMTLAYYLNTEITEKKGRLGHIWHVLNHCLWFCCRKCKRLSCQPSNLVEWYSPCQEAMLSFRHRHHLLIPGQVHQFGCACMEAPKNELIWPMFSYHLILLTSFPSYQCLFGVFHQLGQHLSRPACSVVFSLCRPQLLYHENETRGNVSKCFKVLKRRTYAIYFCDFQTSFWMLDKRRTLVWFFTASAAALIFSSNSQGIYWEYSHCDIWKLEYALQCHHKEHKKYRLRRFKQSFWNKNADLSFFHDLSLTYLSSSTNKQNFINCCSSGSIAQVTAELQRLYGHGSWKWFQVLPMAWRMDIWKRYCIRRFRRW